MDEKMIEKVLRAKAPKVTTRDGEHVLDLDGEIYDITVEDADLLFTTMFFRGKF